MKGIVSKEDIDRIVVNNDSIVKYCNGEDVDDETLNNDINAVLIALCSIIKDKMSNETHCLGYLKEIDGRKAIQIECGIERGSKNSVKMFISRNGFEIFEAELIDVLTIGTIGISIMANVNDLIYKIQQRKGYNISIRYELGYQGERAEIVYWDYDKVKIRLGRKMSIKVIEKYEDGELEGILEDNDMSIDICRLVKEFNRMQFNEAIGATLETDDFQTEISRHMILLEDVPYILNKFNENGIRDLKIRGLAFIDGLSRYVTVCDWDNEGVDIMRDRVLDIECGKFITSKEVVDRIKSRCAVGV